MDRAYEAVHEQALRELNETQPGPRRPLDHSPAEGAKDPEGEFEVPARMTAAHAREAGLGPNQAGNSSGNGPVDPQGQQASTEGGSRANPSLPNEIHPVSDAQERLAHSGRSPRQSEGASGERVLRTDTGNGTSQDLPFSWPTSAECRQNPHHPGCVNRPTDSLANETTGYVDAFCDCHDFAQPLIHSNGTDISWPKGWSSEDAMRWRAEHKLLAVGG